MTNVRVQVEQELLDAAYRKGIDIPAVMRTALEQAVASTRVVPVSTTITPDDEEAGVGPVLSVPIHPKGGYPL